MTDDERHAEIRRNRCEGVAIAIAELFDGIPLEQRVQHMLLKRIHDLVIAGDDDGNETPIVIEDIRERLLATFDQGGEDWKVGDRVKVTLFGDVVEIAPQENEHHDTIGVVKVDADSLRALGLDLGGEVFEGCDLDMWKDT